MLKRHACRYSELEGRQLSGEMAAVRVPDAAADDVEAVVSGLGASADAAIGHVQAATQRCDALSGATDVGFGSMMAHVDLSGLNNDGDALQWCSDIKTAPTSAAGVAS